MKISETGQEIVILAAYAAVIIAASIWIVSYIAVVNPFVS